MTRGWASRVLRARAVRRRAAEVTGSVTLELAIVAPALLLLLSLVVVAARITAAGSAVEQASAAAARAASLMRDPRAASAQAREVVERSLADQGVACSEIDAQIDTSGFAVALGRPADLTVRVTCRVSLTDVAVPGLPGARTLEASATSPLDSYRSRS